MKMIIIISGGDHSGSSSSFISHASLCALAQLPVSCLRLRRDMTSHRDKVPMKLQNFAMSPWKLPGSDFIVSI